MNIASLVVRAFPADFPTVMEALRKIPGVELHGASEEKGSIVVTIEDGEGWSVTDSILAVNLAPKVQGLTIAYEYTDDGLELTEA
ncbi:chaperone NapD [Thauera mechernichensis]|uniref:Chaperone NapD n=1 Tax=Thauera mechernichensis TaxID=82788 RepID=A0ABW3WL98_9RHOO|nr:MULTISPECIES: chaperone NapD [Thauera]ENO82758.1 periplasmic nitrate reductase subunit NapD [Thauera sp. 27]ENO93654.1 periplasmic nitrate reductase subunit NapD [Thauera sp. 28]MDG3065195.1 chaperone NapD [Thauera mechernichensis]WBL64188.1 chaperone NapD [Thauera sp. WB-2]HAG75863.1 nitrate reductase [Thauera sp.]